MQMPIKGGKMNHSQGMLISGYICAATMVALLAAALAEAGGGVFVTICAVGLAAVVGMVLVSDRMLR
jgi:hypothetical protein